jgi:hypothetical protein
LGLLIGYTGYLVTGLLHDVDQGRLCEKTLRAYLIGKRQYLLQASMV